MATGGKSRGEKAGAKKNLANLGKNDDIFNKFMLFIRSPLWRIPVISFIEQRSIVFEKDDPNEKLYMEMHDEFRSLIDALIDSFCEDFKVKPADLIANIKEHKVKSQSPIEQSMLEPVIAAQDYSVFVHMMYRKNIELQLQAVQMIEIMCGLIPEVLRAEEAGRKQIDPSAPEDQEQMLLIQIMKQSQEDFNNMSKRTKKTVDPDLERALEESVKEKERLEELHSREEELLQRAMALSLEDSGRKSESSDTTGSDKGKPARPKSRSGAGKRDIETDVTVKPETKRPPSAQKTRQKSFDESSEVMGMVSRPKSKTRGQARTADLTQSSPAGAIKAAKEGLSGIDLDERRRYLMQQRDKLLAMKKMAREKAFSLAEKDTKMERPRTAQTARSAMKGRNTATAQLDPEVLAARKALAQKLKQEVMGQ